MKHRIKLLLCIVALTGVLRSSAMADPPQLTPPQISIPAQVQSVADFDISGAVQKLAEKKKIRNDAILHNNGDKAATAAALQQFEQEKNAVFEIVRQQRRREYEKYIVRVSVTGMVSVNRSGDVRIDCPSTPAGLQIIQGSERNFVKSSINGSAKTVFSNGRYDTGYTVYVSHHRRILVEDLSAADRRHGPPPTPVDQIEVSADFRLNDTKIDELTNRDLEILKLRIMQAL